MHVAYGSAWIAIIACLLTAAYVCSAAVFFVIRRVCGRARSSSISAIEVSTYCAAALGLVCCAYATFVEPFSLEIVHVPLSLGRLPVLSQPITIAQISDLHCDETARLEYKLCEAVERAKPDVIVFTGDSANSAKGWPVFFKVVKRLQRVAPFIVVKGDWDFATNWSPLEKAGLRPLNGHLLFSIRGSNICIAGHDSGSSSEIALREVPGNVPLILLYHSPDDDVVMNQQTRGIDLILCGHTHGGQIAAPIYGPLISQSKTKLKYVSGLHRINDTWIYTNRGIGMEGHFPPMRFCAKPELTIFELTGAVNSPALKN